MAGHNKELVLYAAVARGQQIVARYSSTNEDIDRVAVEALKEVPEHSSRYTMGFDDIMIAICRDAAQHDRLFLLGCHSALTKDRAFQLLSKVKELYYHHTNISRKFRSTSADHEGFIKKLESKMGAHVQVRGHIPPKEDLVVYPDGPRAYLVRNPADEEPPEDYVPPEVAKASGRKSLQEELADLGDDSESDSDVSDAGLVKSPKKVPGDSIVQSKRDDQHVDEVPFPYQKARAAASKAAWSTEIRQPRQEPKVAGPGRSGPPSSTTWSMEYSKQSAKAYRDQKAGLEAVSERTSSGESKASQQSGRKSSTGDQRHHLLQWAEKEERRNGGDIRDKVSPAYIDIIVGTTALRSDSPDALSSAEGSPADIVDRVPLRGPTPTSSDEHQRSGGNGRRKAMWTWTAPNIPRTNSKSQEYAARVSPEEGLQRESRTEMYASPRAFVSERSNPTPGKIGDRAPSGLTWEEEIRQMHVARGLAPPRPFSVSSNSPGAEGAERQTGAGKQCHKHPAAQAVDIPRSESAGVSTRDAGSHGLWKKQHREPRVQKKAPVQKKSGCLCF